MTLLGWREVPTDNSSLGESVKPTEPVHLQVFIGRGRKIKTEDEFERRLYILRKSISQCHLHSQASAVFPATIPCRCPAAPWSTRACSWPTSSAPIIPTCTTRISRARSRSCTSASRPTPSRSWSLAHPYRMVAHNGEINTLRGNVNWMAARQASVSSDAVRRRHQQALADLLRGPVRHRLLRQRARVPGAGRLLARPRGDDADPGSLGRQSADGRGAPRLLRIPRRADGAVGRPGGDRLHRRPPDRRHARPQRPAPGALSSSPATTASSWRRRWACCRFPEKDIVTEVAAAARQDAARRSRGGPHHLRRGDQGDAGAQPSLQGVARAHADRARRSCRPAQHARAHQPVAARSPAGLRLHAGGPAAPDGADGADRPGSRRLDGHRHADLGAVATSRSCSTPISSRTSRR